MQRAFGGGSGSGIMMRTIQRAVRTGAGGSPAESFSGHGNTTVARANSRTEKTYNNTNKQPTSPNAALYVSSSAINFPISGASEGSSSSRSSIDDGSEGEWAHVSYEDFVFGTNPSGDEVHHAVSSLQQVLNSSSYMSNSKEKLEGIIDKDDVSNFGKINSSSETDWMEPSWDVYNSRVMQSHGADRVYDAFHLLQTDPSVQRMVVSLSSDRAVWDAVLSNDVVKELRSSITPTTQGESSDKSEGSGESNPVKDILSWIIENAKAKVIRLINNISMLVNQLLLLKPSKEETANVFEEKLKTSLLLSVVVLLVVVITRAQSASS